MILIMTVEPGFGGQCFINSMTNKISKTRKLFPNIDIQVDGGINPDTAKLCHQAGANIFVSGSYIFKANDRKQALQYLRFSLL